MRILFIHNEYGNPSGEEHAAQMIADLLKDNGHEVFWFERSSAGLADSVGGKIKAFFTGIYNPFAAKALAKTIDEVRPDIIQVQNLYPLISPSIFKSIKKRRIPVVMRCPNYRLFCPNGLHLCNQKVCERCLSFGKELWCVLKNCENNLFKSTGYALRNYFARITKSILNNVDMYIVQTEFQKKKFIERGVAAERIGIVPGVIQSTYIQDDKKLGELVTYIGRISIEKGIEDFLEAARLIPEIPFAVAGNNNHMPDIHNKRPFNVKLLGFLQSNELIDLYQKSRIIVIPSRWYEGFPNVVLQAMAQARPIVAARIGALSSIIEDNKNGLLFEPGNKQELAEKIQYLWNQEQLCLTLGQAARKKAQDDYSPKKCYEALINVYIKAEKYKI